MAAAWSVGIGNEYAGVDRRESTHRQAWATGTALVRAGTHAMQSIDPATGKVNWETRLPPHKGTCEAARRVGSVAVITYGTVDDKRCDHVFVVDVATGAVAQDIARSPETDGEPVVDVLDDALYLGSPGSPPRHRDPDASAEVVKIDGRTGARVWQAGLDGCFEVVDVMTSSRRILVTARCRGQSSVIGPWQLVSLDPASGARQWSSPIAGTEQFKPVAMLSAEPPILAHYQAGTSCCYRQSYAVYNDTGAVALRIERGNGNELAAGLSRHWHDRLDASVHHRRRHVDRGQLGRRVRGSARSATDRDRSDHRRADLAHRAFR